MQQHRAGRRGRRRRRRASRQPLGELGWSGPAPPIGDEPHRYFFHLYAVDRPLGLAEGTNADDLLAALDGHILATGTLVGIFGR